MSLDRLLGYLNKVVGLSRFLSLRSLPLPRDTGSEHFMSEERWEALHRRQEENYRKLSSTYTSGDVSGLPVEVVIPSIYRTAAVCSTTSDYKGNGTGWVYVLTNPCMRGVVKVGMTTADPERRAEDLYTTGVAAPFKVAYKARIGDNKQQQVEHAAHEILRKYRRSKRREFFRCDLNTAIAAIRQAAGEHLAFDEEIP